MLRNVFETLMYARDINHHVIATTISEEKRTFAAKFLIFFFGNCKILKL